MNRVLIAAAALILLTACAGNRFYPVEGDGGGQYYLGESPASTVRYRTAYSPLFAYGVSPWWGYTYYSPYFYPHFFSVWYTPWTYYAPWPYASHWYAGRAYGYPPYRRYHRRYPGVHPGAEIPSAPPAAIAGPPAGLPIPNQERVRMLDDLTLQREMRYGSMSAAQRRTIPSARRFDTPAASTGQPGMATGGAAATGSYGSFSRPGAGRASPTRSRAGSGTVSRRNPARHDQ